MGHGYAVGADNYNANPNATTLVKFDDTTTVRPVGPLVHFNKRWDIAAATHIAHGNARPGTPESQYACGGNPGSDYERVPKGKLDVTGRYFIWTTNIGGDRLDVFLVKIPADVLIAP